LRCGFVGRCALRRCSPTYGHGSGGDIYAAEQLQQLESGRSDQPGGGGGGAVAMMDTNDDFLHEIILNLSQIGSYQQWYQWRNELFSRTTVDIHDRAAVRAWHAAIYRRHGRRLVGRRPCTLGRPLYRTAPPGSGGGGALPVVGKVWCPDAGVCANR